VAWATENLFPRAPLPLQNWIRDLAQFDVQQHQMLQHANQHLGKPVDAALRYFFKFVEAHGPRPIDWKQQGLQFTQAYALRLGQSSLQRDTWMAYYSNLVRGLRLLQDHALLPQFEIYQIKPAATYRVLRDQWPNEALKTAAQFFYDHACLASFTHHEQWPWDPVKPQTRDSTLQVVEQFVGFLMNHYPGGGLDISTMTPDEIFSRQHLTTFRAFNVARNGDQPNRGLTSIFECLVTFCHRALQLDLRRFDLLYDPNTPARLLPNKERTLAQWLAIRSAVQQDLRGQLSLRKRLSLQRFEMFLHLLIATLGRAGALVQVHLNHLVWEGNYLFLLIPPEHQKNKRFVQPHWERIPLTADVVDCLTRYREQVLPALLKGQTSPYLFPQFPPRKGHVHRNTTNELLKDYDQKANGVARQDATSCHRIRKTATLTMVRHQDKQGAFMASRALGHTSTQVTRKSYLNSTGAKIVMDDWHIRELLAQRPLTDRNLRDALEILRKDPTEWNMLRQGLDDLARNHPA
jgi:integrase